MNARCHSIAPSSVASTKQTALGAKEWDMIGRRDRAAEEYVASPRFRRILEKGEQSMDRTRLARQWRFPDQGLAAECVDLHSNESVS
jgi:hypothetical protein